MTCINDAGGVTGSLWDMSLRTSIAKVAAASALLLLASCETSDRTPDGSPAATAEATGLPSLSGTMDAEAASRGRAIAIVGCASCHAINSTGASAFAAAPPFRDVVRRRSLDDLETAFATGLVTTHPAMPPYVFRASEIDDLIAYFGTLKAAQQAPRRD